jgi:hypothetical protein
MGRKQGEKERIVRNRNWQHQFAAQIQQRHLQFTRSLVQKNERKRYRQHNQLATQIQQRHW